MSPDSHDHNTSHQHHGSGSAGCCGHQSTGAEQKSACHSGNRFDWILWGALVLTVPFFIADLLFQSSIGPVPYLGEYSQSVHQLFHKMWWGVAAGIGLVGLIGVIPREFVMKVLGSKRGIGGLMRATLAGVMFDLCSHGILLIAMKLYERGVSLPQVVAFLIASPWNSLSLTVILISLIGLEWTLAFVVLSIVIALITGLIFEVLEDRKIVAPNPNKSDLPTDFNFFAEAKTRLAEAKVTPAKIGAIIRGAAGESQMILRWIVFGVVLASLIRTFVPPETFSTYFGPSVLGLVSTIVVATILEVCSEGSSPIAADILNRAGAPGNAFAFLMTGVSTDYTEIMTLKETTKSWRPGLLLPLVTLPQIIVISYLINF